MKSPFAVPDTENLLEIVGTPEVWGQAEGGSWGGGGWRAVLPALAQDELLLPENTDAICKTAQTSAPNYPSGFTTCLNTLRALKNQPQSM